MLFARSIVLCVLLTFAAAQEKVSPDAPGLIHQMLVATGWQMDITPAQVTVNVEYANGNSEPLRGTSIWKIKDARTFRIDDQDGGTGTIVNGSRALASAAGKHRNLPAHEISGMRPFILPAVTEIGAAYRQGFYAQYLRTEQINGEPADVVLIARDLRDQIAVNGTRVPASAVMVWISKTSSLPLQIAYWRTAEDNPTVAFSFVRTFSDYRGMSGVRIPFRQTESVNGRVLRSFTIVDLKINTEIESTDFDIK